MMIKWFSVLCITSVLLNRCCAQNSCTSKIVNVTEIIFTCLSNITISELPLYDYTTDELERITSIVVNGPDENTRGPFTSIPPNICFLPNLQSINFSNNRIIEVDAVNALSGCLSNVTTLDVSYNNISVFPSVMVYNMPTLINFYFQHNSLVNVPGNAFSDITKLQRIDFSYNYLTTFEFWACLVKISADFSNNRISTITNSLFLNISQYYSPQSRVSLTNNSLSINLTDAIFEMYGACSEANTWLNDTLNGDELVYPALTLSLSYIDFGTTRVNCSCDQAYIIHIFNAVYSTITDKSIFPFYHTMCTDGTRLINHSCNSTTGLRNSSVDFAQVYPRLCKIYPEEIANVTIAPNISAPTSNLSSNPYYERGLMDPGVCLFSFINTMTVEIKCTNDVTNSSRIPPDLLTSNYFSNITRVIYDPPISSLPFYLCSLPSHQIDLSYQSFTTLTYATFPYLDYFTRVTLSHNNISTVSMASGNFTNLTYLDLSSNHLTTIPHSILIPTPSSLRLLDLRNNSITSIDIILLTLKNITVLLDGNPINGSNIINPGNITFPSTNNTNSTANISFPPTITDSTYIVTDQAVLTVGACNLNTILTYLNMLRLIYSNIALQCTCTSIHLKEIFLQNGSNILNTLNCSNGTSATNYTNLTISSCGSAALYFVSDLCYNDSLQWTTIITTLGTITTTISTSMTTFSTETNFILIPSERESDTNRTGLIIGLVIGLVAFVALLGSLIAARIIKSKKSAALHKPIRRTMAMSQAPHDALLQSRLQTRNLRTVRLTPLTTRPSPLPPLSSGSIQPVTMVQGRNNRFRSLTIHRTD